MSYIVHRAAAILIAAAILAPGFAQAQTWGDPNLPRSPYAMPEPTSRGPDIDDLINGNGKLHFSGQWRHYGDSRNSGETALLLLAPNQVLGHGRTANGLPSSRFCYDNPDRC